MLQAKSPMRSSSAVIQMAARMRRRSMAMGCWRASSNWQLSSISTAAASSRSSPSMISWAATRLPSSRAWVARAPASVADAPNWMIWSRTESRSSWNVLRVSSVMAASQS